MPTEDSLTRTADKTGVIGAIIASFGCAACFPALGSLGAGIGLSFLSQYEGPFIRYVLPLSALIVLAANLRSHKTWLRLALGVTGPVLVLIAALLMSLRGVRAEWVLYAGLVLMIGVSILDLVSPPGRRFSNPIPSRNR
ncbi:MULTISPECIES: organomercurial transporter MerC [unclassified Sphingomonas]|uniref:organomercurial transporter MerC n=1 Tax=unclassified Sphingomonas TaxID=196159 RepID=UPI000560B3F1|nr:MULTISPECIES: organomercurial transporter MerC [unclassified Sphingomonas]